MELVILLAVILGQQILLAYLAKQHQNERLEWTQSLIAKDAKEYNDIKLTQNVSEQPQKTEFADVPPEYSDLDSFDDKKYLEIINQGVTPDSK